MTAGRLVYFALMRVARGSEVADGGGDGDNAVVVISEIRKPRTENLRVRGQGKSLRFPGVGAKFSESVKFVRLLDGGLVTFSLGGENVQNDGFVLSF